MLENKEAEIDSIEYSDTAAEEPAAEGDEIGHAKSSTGDTGEEKDERSREELYAATEAILFSMGDAVELPHLAQAMSLSAEDMREVLVELAAAYDNEARGIQIIELEGAYQLCTKRELYDYLVKIAHVPKPKELTDVMLETLSIIAYKQPVTKLEIEKIRGVKSDHTVNKLVEYNLVCEAGRKDAPGRPILFATTEEFLRSFGIESTEELPELDTDIVEEIKHEAETEIDDSMQMKLDI
ncbi:MAG: SMC-Scp complex subunit ScpB [Lachnospiraceae bacterium]|nr:SMC-Scp complex subunit ScpB [Lachnospiraceae bacterium]